MECGCETPEQIFQNHVTGTAQWECSECGCIYIRDESDEMWHIVYPVNNATDDPPF
jgi:hypothetical protein